MALGLHPGTAAAATEAALTQISAAPPSWSHQKSSEEVAMAHPHHQYLAHLTGSSLVLLQALAGWC